jgi:RNA polymerase sigma-70 factor (ECF subfamily)
VVNRALDLVRSERRLVGLEAVGDVVAQWDGDDAEDPQALAALAGLSPERRVVVVLRHLLGYAPPEIAAILDVPLGTVHSRLARALADLRAALEDRDDDS